MPRVLNQRIRGAWDKFVRPVGKAVARSGLSANTITVIGVLVQGYAAYLILEGALVAAGLVTIAAGAADVLDGAVAKAKGSASKFGALLDSTTDRLADALLFLPIAWLYAVEPDIPGHHELWVAAVALAALVASFLVSYVKARAESLGFDCNVGIAERAERVILVILGLVFNIVPAMVVVLAIVSGITFLQRLLHVASQARSAAQ